MIPLKRMKLELADWLEKTTGVPCVTTAARTGVYPLVVISLHRESVGWIAGGKQRQETVRVTLDAVSDREREGQDALSDLLFGALLSGFCLEGHWFTPEGLGETEREDGSRRISFCLCWCELPGTEAEETTAPAMETLELELIG